MNKNKLTGILGSSIACAAAEVVVNIIAYGIGPHLMGAAVVGLILGGIVGCLIAAFGSDRPIFGGVVATAVVFGGLMLGLALIYNVTAVKSAFDLFLVAVTVLVFGAVNGFGYRFLGPKN